MICALMIDPDDSVDFPGNKGMALGRPLAAYPLMSAKTSPYIQRLYVISDSPPVKAIALQYGAILIDPPAAPGPDPSAQSLLEYGFGHIVQELLGEKEQLELLVVLLSNAPAMTRELLDGGIETLQARPELDSAVSVSPYNRWNPFYARLETATGLLQPYIPPASDSRGDVWFPDWGVSILRPRCLESLSGEMPTPWLGRKILPLKQWGGGPIDYQWQIPSLEFWLKKHGSSDISSLELQPLPKLQPAPKSDRR